MTGPALPRPSAAPARDTPPRQDDSALQQARIEALKQAADALREATRDVARAGSAS